MHDENNINFISLQFQVGLTLKMACDFKLEIRLLESLSNEDGNVRTMDLSTEYNHFTWECNHLATFPPSSLERERKNLNSGVL